MNRLLYGKNKYSKSSSRICREFSENSFLTKFVENHFPKVFLVDFNIFQKLSENSPRIFQKTISHGFYQKHFPSFITHQIFPRILRQFWSTHFLCYRYIDDLIVFNNKKFLDYLKEIYPSQLTVEKANKSDHLADYLDLTFIIDSGGKLSTRLYDKRDDFDFHIVNFPFLSSNIPSGPSYGVYISQLIRYARCCSHYDDFRYRHKCLVDRLLSQGYKALRLEKSFKKFYGRYQDLIEKYRRSVNAMVSDSFPRQFLFNM